MQTIGERLRQARGAETQLDFAARTGLKQQTISRCERGETPSTAVLVALAEVTNLSIDWLLFGRGGMWLD